MIKRSLFVKTKIATGSLFFLIISISAGSSCNRNGGSGINKEVNASVDVTKKPAATAIHITTPANGASLSTREPVSCQISIPDSLKADSLQFKVDGIRVGVALTSPYAFNWKNAVSKVGTRSLQAIAFLKNGSKAFDQVQFKLLPEKAPAYGYKVIKAYPHDKDAYTQGLIFDNGYLYEGTGINGKSSLRKEKLTGEIINALTLPSDLFGEGVTTFDDKLIQITWTSQVAFIYDKASFKQIVKLNYPMKEGWGITYNGTNLLMSDGSAFIYTLDKQDLSEVSRIEVCDEQGPVNQINELEYINGQIWANVYQTDLIVRIDPITGAIVGKINMAGLLQPDEKDENTNVLNGIAYDPKTSRIFVTGKNWPKLFEISVFQK